MFIYITLYIYLYIYIYINNIRDKKGASYGERPESGMRAEGGEKEVDDMFMTCLGDRSKGVLINLIKTP